MFVITGGATGIGKALAHALAARQKSVLIIGRREPLLIETATFSGLIHYLCADISTSEGRNQVVSRLEHADCIDGLIHNAGIIEPIKNIRRIKESEWQQIMATNLNAPLFLTQLLYNKLLNGRVLNISSGAAYFPVAGWTAYCTSKAALSMLTRCWQLESDSVVFASVMPGITDTDMQAKIRHASDMQPEKIEFFNRLHDDQQLVSPDTVARFLCWLLLDIDTTHFVSQEWDIYDQTHHSAWLISPYSVPPLE